MKNRCWKLGGQKSHHQVDTILSGRTWRSFSFHPIWSFRTEEALRIKGETSSSIQSAASYISAFKDPEVYKGESVLQEVLLVVCWRKDKGRVHSLDPYAYSQSWLLQQLHYIKVKLNSSILSVTRCQITTGLPDTIILDLSDIFKTTLHTDPQTRFFFLPEIKFNIKFVEGSKGYKFVFLVVLPQWQARVLLKAQMCILLSTYFFKLFYIFFRWIRSTETDLMKHAFMTPAA